MINNPNRYTGMFRLTNAKTKLLQNVTQSHEIKFGDFLEDIITEYLTILGYQNLDKNIGCDLDGNQLSADQVFKDSSTYYLIEQKMRDDHDSTKKRGQIDNFKKKCECLRMTYPGARIISIMWFVDESLTKNKNFYQQEMEKINTLTTRAHVVYGKELFSNKLLGAMDVWNELCNHLKENKRERSEEVLFIPDFDTSPEIEKALKRLKLEQPRLFTKLLSNKVEYIQLRNELFPTKFK